MSLIDHDFKIHLSWEKYDDIKELKTVCNKHSYIFFLFCFFKSFKELQTNIDKNNIEHWFELRKRNFRFCIVQCSFIYKY